VPTDPLAEDLADITDFEELDNRADAAFMRDELLGGVRHDLIAASFFWQQRPRHARRLLQRATDVLDFLYADEGASED
jgi:hypothetical protein